MDNKPKNFLFRGKIRELPSLSRALFSFHQNQAILAKRMGSFSQGGRTYTPPSLNQIYAQKEKLSSEIIDQWTLGIEKSTNKSLWGTDFFYTRYRTAIAWEEESRLYKMERDQRDLFGTEWFFQNKINPLFNIKGFLNLTKGRNAKGELEDIPGMARSHLGLTTDFNTQKWFWLTHLKTFLNYKTASKTQNFSLVNTSIGRRVNRKTTLQLKINNLFNEGYFLKEGYQTKGINYFLKASMLF